MSGTTQCYHREQCDTNGKEVGQMQSQRYESEDASCSYLGDYDEELLGLVELKQGAPQEFREADSKAVSASKET